MTTDTALDRLPIHDTKTAPEASRPVLEGAEKSYGFLPNLLGVLASSPVALRAYTSLAQLLEEGTLSPAERQVAFLSISVTNRCRYCVAAHSALAAGAGVPATVIDAIRDGQAVEAPRLGALARLTRELVEQRGFLPPEEVDAFLAAGFRPAQLLEVVAALAMKTISNYTNHLAETPLDAAFRRTSWAPSEAR